ncbi:MAG: glycosyltransferase family 2 protein, partial [Methylococcales bacterium]
MISLIELIFWVSSILIVYNYFIYPVFIILISKVFKSDNGTVYESLTELPEITFIIAAYNEEKVIHEKILNTLSLDYPENKLEVLVVSDGSDDKTQEIVLGFENDNVVSLHEQARKGKSSALNRAVENARGEILILSDANNLFNKNACIELIKHFNDKKVGGVTGLKKIIEDDDRESSEGDSLYWKYESRIKQAESDIKTITNADGEIFAIRKSLYEPIPEYIINDDAELTFSLRRQGYTIKYEMSAISTEKASINIKDDYFVKVRMVAGAYQTIVNHWKDLIQPLDVFSYMFISHKLMRWLVPHFMVLAFISNALLISYDFYL